MADIAPFASARPRPVAAWLLVIATLAVGASSVLGVRWAAQRVDDFEAQVQRAQALGTLDEYRDRLRSAAGAELQWDEAVQRLDLAFDPEWADTSLVEWLSNSQGIEDIVVLDADDRPIYAATDGERTDPLTTAAACTDPRMVAELRHRERARGPLPRPAPDFDVQLSAPIDAVGFVKCGPHPAILVATLVQPDFGLHMPRGPRAPIVFTARRLDDAVAARIGASLMLAESRFEPPSARPPGARWIALTAGDGAEVARFAWRPDRPGAELAREAGPFLGLGLAGLLGLLATALIALRRAQDLVRDTAARAQRHAESLERMSALSRIGAWETTPDGTTMQLSRESARILGLDGTAPHPLARVLARFAPESFGRVESALGDAQRFGAPMDLVASTDAAAGERRVLRLRGRPASHAGARVIEGTLQDITEQVERQQAQRRNTELLERMSRIADIGGWEYQVESRILTFTEQSYRIYGLRPGEPVSLERIAALYDAADGQRIVAVLTRALRDGSPWDLELSPTTADGRRIHVRGLGEAELANGRVVRLFGTLQDTTIAHDAAQQLRDAMRRLEDRNAEIQQFTFAASHDLQEPARKVQALGSLLLARHGTRLDAAARDCIERMQRSSERMAQLIDDVLAYSRAALRPVDPQPVDLAKVAREVLEDLESRTAASGAMIVVGTLPEIEGDPLQLRRLLQNLVVNALKYRHPDRTPEIRLGATLFQPTAHASWCRLSVEDNGLGFDNRHAAQIFLPFTRLQREQAGGNEGSGIGLAIVRRVAELHGGTVHATGRPGEGARFVVELPLRQTHRTQDPGAGTT